MIVQDLERLIRGADYVYGSMHTWEEKSDAFVYMNGSSLTSGTRTSKDSFKGTDTMPISFTLAETLYMPYVGGVMRILSLPGIQKTLIKRSMASSLPTPMKIWLGLHPLEFEGKIEMGSIEWNEKLEP